MQYFKCEPLPCRKKISRGKIFFENRYIKWRMDASTGKLDGAFVRFGSGKNLLTEPLSCRLICKEAGKQVAYAPAFPPEKVETGEDFVRSSFAFLSAGKEKLPGLTAEYFIRFGALGEAEITLSFRAEKEIKNVITFQNVLFGVKDTINAIGVRNRFLNSPGYYSQNPVSWHFLNKGESFQDPLPLLSCNLPLSLLFLQTGVEAVQFELGEDLASWEPFPREQECAILQDKKTNGYQARLASFFFRPGETLQGEMRFSFRLTLPFVKEKVVPFRRASSLFYFERGCEKRWPEEEDFAAMEKAHYDLLRLHCDNDRYGNGVFWPDAVYPPFSSAEMKKMDACIRLAHKHNIRVVPYFSIKEIHPTAPGYDENVKDWAHLGAKGRMVRTSVFGSVLCLNSPWEKMRRETILLPLQKHAFDGIYYDWCCGMECDNPAHSQNPHWDNDALLRHIYWTCRELPEDQKERYIHVTNVPSLAVENAATMIIAEENPFPRINPYMFSPQVHFLNLAPRQICDMLEDSTEEDQKRLGLCALLYHASVSSIQKTYLELYKNMPWLEELEKYDRHSAPGEGIIESGPDHGFSIYWNKEECLILGVNLTEKPVRKKFSAKCPSFQEVRGFLSIPPLACAVKRCKLRKVKK